MICILVKDGVVDMCVSIDPVNNLSEMYPDHLILEQAGSETVGWTYDGVTFTAPKV